MTQTLHRPEESHEEVPARVPSHPHYTLGTMVALGVLGTLVAVGLAIAGLIITASRNSVDDAIVAERVDTFLAESGSTAGVAQGEVIPAIVPKAQMAPVPADEVNVAVAPDMPPASGRTAPAIVDVTFEIVEGVHAIDPANGIEFETWGFRLVDGPDGIVSGTPGPVIRTRVGDVLRFTLINPETNTHPHNVDFHAVTGAHGGASELIVAPGETKTIEARMLYPGFFMYHCAYDDVPAHISRGMYGGILVDPEVPLPTVDHEWYVVQSEYYTTGDGGVVEMDRAAVTNEDPSYVVFNGAVGAIAGDNALQMEVGERSRIYFVNAGLNLVSSFHPIGSQWDKVYPEAAILSPPLRGSQTTLIPAGGGTVVEMVGYVPSEVVLVDHALGRAFDKGAIGHVMINGEANPEIFAAVGGEGSGDHAGEHTDTTAAPVTGGEQITIPTGAGDVQEMDAPDEFAENESIVDYSVNVLTIKAGTTVTWTNEDAMMHTVTAVDGSFDSGYLNEGDTWSYTFDTPGEYEYFCAPHPWMRAKVIVEA